MNRKPKPPRTARLVVRCHPEELADWHQKAAAQNMELSRYVRGVLAGQHPSKHTRSDPALLRQLAGIGNNLNQIARWVNTRKSGALVMRVLAALKQIESELKAIAHAH